MNKEKIKAQLSKKWIDVFMAVLNILFWGLVFLMGQSRLAAISGPITGAASGANYLWIISSPLVLCILVLLFITAIVFGFGFLVGVRGKLRILVFFITLLSLLSAGILVRYENQRNQSTGFFNQGYQPIFPQNR